MFRTDAVVASVVLAFVSLLFPSPAAGGRQPTLYWLGRSFENFRFGFQQLDDFVYHPRPPRSADHDIVVENRLLSINRPRNERPPCLRTTIRGVPAQIVGTSYTTIVIVYTGRRAIVVGAGPRLRILRAAWALRPHYRTAAPRRNLARPVFNVSRGLRRCRTLAPALTG
jgi:hypothetical protein